jgi:hypothetical protein
LQISYDQCYWEFYQAEGAYIDRVSISPVESAHGAT